VANIKPQPVAQSARARSRQVEQSSNSVGQHSSRAEQRRDAAARVVEAQRVLDAVEVGVGAGDTLAEALAGQPLADPHRPRDRQILDMQAVEHGAGTDPHAASSSNPKVEMRCASSHTPNAPTIPTTPAALITATGSVELIGKATIARHTRPLNRNSSVSDQAIGGRRATTRRVSERSSTNPSCVGGNSASTRAAPCRSDRDELLIIAAYLFGLDLRALEHIERPTTNLVAPRAPSPALG
jgi:hypothetical protein